MKIANWIDAHVRAYEYFGGVPKITIPDNTKTAVIKPDRVDPVNKQELQRNGQALQNNHSTCKSRKTKR